MVTINDVVKQMEARVGEGGAYYWKKYGLSSGTAWCAAAVSASFADAGAKKYFYNGKPVFYVPYAQQWLKKNAKHVPLSDVRRGDVIIFTWDGNGYNKERGSRDHIGFARADSTGNTLFTVEGNTSGGKVARRDRPAKYIYGVYRVYVNGEAPQPTPPPTPGELEEDGVFGVQSKKRMQKWLGVAEDGIIKKITIRALQRKCGLTGKDVDGVWGKKTTKALQSYLGGQGFYTRVDGAFGKDTVLQLQRFLNNHFFPKNPSDTKTTEPSVPTPVDVPNLGKVIDISAWQGNVSVENFKKAKADGVTAVILRSSYTTQKSFALYRDKVFENNIKNAISAGLPVGVYHYSQAISVAEAIKEANFVLDIIAPFKQSIQLPVAFDWEFGGRLSRSRAMNNGKATNKKICDAFCNAIQAAGFVPMVYANLDTLNNYISNDLSKSWKVWVAQYNKTCDYKYPRYLWQYTSSGKVNGLSGRIDMNKG